MTLKRNLLILSATVTGILGASSSSYAGMNFHASQFYVEPAIGAWIDHTHDYDTGPIGALTVGYDFTNQFALQAAAYAGPNAHAVVGEGIWNIPVNDARWSRWNPYLALGAGYMSMDHDGFGMDVGAGIRYAMTSNMELSLNYRYMQLFDNDLHNGSVVTAGFRVYFGGAGTSLYGDRIIKDRYALPKGIERCVNDMPKVTTEAVGCYSVGGDQVTMHLNVKFALNKATLTNQSKVAVKRLAKFMTVYPSTNAVLYGYASSEGKKGLEQFNKNLSLKRANSVRHYLKHLGVSPSRVKTVGMGTQDQIASNDTARGRAANRRVQANVDVPLKK